MSVAVALAVPFDQLRIVEIVTGEAQDTVRKPGAKLDLLGIVEKRDLDAFDLILVFVDDPQDAFERRLELGAAPITRQLRIEHVAEPVQDDLVPGLRENATIDLGVIVSGGCDAGKRAARHHDGAAAMLLHIFDLCFVRPDDIIKRSRLGRDEMIGSGAAGEIDGMRSNSEEGAAGSSTLCR